MYWENKKEMRSLHWVEQTELFYLNKETNKLY